MRRVLALPLVAAALMIPAGLATAALDDVKGPTCADIAGPTPTDPGADFFYSLDGATATVTLYLNAASCRNISYTLVVLDSATDATLQNSNSVPGDGEPNNASGIGTDTVTVTANVTQQDGEVCLYATTSSGRHIFDRVPDANCIELQPGDTGGGGGFN